MGVILATLLYLALGTGTGTVVEGPCKAVHYARPGYGTTMQYVVAKRQRPGTSDYIAGFSPRLDVYNALAKTSDARSQGFIAVRNADQWRIAANYRALVSFKLPSGGYSKAVWLQPADYQKRSDMTSKQCRVETSAALAQSMGWSIYQGWGRTTAYILRWEK